MKMLKYGKIIIAVVLLIFNILIIQNIHTAAGHGHIFSALVLLDRINELGGPDFLNSDSEIAMLKRFFFNGNGTPKESLVQAYLTGAVMPDTMGVFLGEILQQKFAHFPHYVDTGIYYTQLLANAGTSDEAIAFALGNISHYIVDKYTHPIVNKFAGSIYGKPGTYEVVEFDLDKGTVIYPEGGSPDPKLSIPGEANAKRRHAFLEYWFVKPVLEGIGSAGYNIDLYKCERRNNSLFLYDDIQYYLPIGLADDLDHISTIGIEIAAAILDGNRALLRLKLLELAAYLGSMTHKIEEYRNHNQYKAELLSRTFRQVWDMDTILIGDADVMMALLTEILSILHMVDYPLPLYTVEEIPELLVFFPRGFIFMLKLALNKLRSSLPGILITDSETCRNFLVDLANLPSSTDVTYSTLYDEYVYALYEEAPKELLAIFSRIAYFIDKRIVSRVTLTHTGLPNISLDSGRLCTWEDNQEHEICTITKELFPIDLKAYMTSGQENSVGVLRIHDIKNPLTDDQIIKDFTQGVINSIPAQSIAIDSTGRFAWIGNRDGTLSWIDTWNDEEVSGSAQVPRIYTGINPGAMAITPDGRTLYVTSPDSGKVIPVDLLRFRVMTDDAFVIPCKKISDIVIDPSGVYAFILVQNQVGNNPDGGEVFRINIQKTKIIQDEIVRNPDYHKTDRSVQMNEYLFHGPRSISYDIFYGDLYVVDFGVYRRGNRVQTILSDAMLLDRQIYPTVGTGNIMSRQRTIQMDQYACTVLTAPGIIEILASINPPPGVLTKIIGYEVLPAFTNMIIGLCGYGQGIATAFLMSTPFPIRMQYYYDPLYLNLGGDIVTPPCSFRYGNEDLQPGFSNFWYTGNMGILDRADREFIAGTRSVLGDEYKNRQVCRWTAMASSNTGDIVTIDTKKNKLAFFGYEWFLHSLNGNDKKDQIPLAGAPTIAGAGEYLQGRIPNLINTVSNFVYKQIIEYLGMDLLQIVNEFRNYPNIAVYDLVDLAYTITLYNRSALDDYFAGNTRLFDTPSGLKDVAIQPGVYFPLPMTCQVVEGTRNGINAELDFMFFSRIPIQAIEVLNFTNGTTMTFLNEGNNTGDRNIQLVQKFEHFWEIVIKDETDMSDFPVHQNGQYHFEFELRLENGVNVRLSSKPVIRNTEKPEANQNTSMIACDVSGLHTVNGSVPDYFASINRIPPETEPDGIACDTLENAADGARLLFALVDESGNTQSPLSSVEFGYMNIEGEFSPLTEGEGEFLDLGDAEKSALVDNDIIIEAGGLYTKDNKRILASKVYKPPAAFDTNPNNMDLTRKLVLAAKDMESNIIYLKKILLVRPPLVFVHGINGDGNAWNDWIDSYPAYLCYKADHSSSFHGNGDVRKVYQFVCDAIEKDGDNNSALYSLRNGASRLGEKRIAVQKCDIIAHSYGGVVSRWYIEAPLDARNESNKEYRHDVRKLITLGTPHRGTPAANVLFEIANNPVLFNGRSVFDITIGGIVDTMAGGTTITFTNTMTGIAFSLPLPRDAILPFANEVTGREDEDTVGYVMELLHRAGRVRWHDDEAPMPDPGHPVNPTLPAIHILGYKSALLDIINEAPLHDDVAYCTIAGDGWVGVDPYGIVQIDLFKMAESRDRRDSSHNYFPWLTKLTPDNDGVVPTWSAALCDYDEDQGDPDQTQSILAHVGHINYIDNSDIRAIVLKWLYRKDLETGSDLRDSVLAKKIDYRQSIDNLYRGCDLNLQGTGIHPDAIVRTVLTGPENDTDNQTTRIDALGGVIDVVCTGMINEPAHLSLIGMYDNFGASQVTVHLDDTIFIPYSGGYDPTSGDYEYVPFKVEDIIIGRTENGGVIGQNETECKNPSLQTMVFGKEYYIYYDYDQDIKSPLWKLEVEKYELPTIAPMGPLTGNPDSWGFTARGGVAVKADEYGPESQYVQIEIFDKDVSILPDDLLAKPDCFISKEPSFIEGMILPYEIQFVLWKDMNGNITGDLGSSGQNPVYIYQKIILGDEHESETLKVEF